jgi:hypothetical protein
MQKLRVLNIDDITIHFKISQKKEVAKILSIKPLHIKGPNLVSCGTPDLKEEEERMKWKRT